MKYITSILVAATVLCACGGNKYDKEAAGIIKMAQKEFEAKHYNRAILLIDSMRTHFPQAIETRKLALELYNNVSLAKAQTNLAHTDSALHMVTLRYETMKTYVDSMKKSFNITEEQIRELNTTKAQLDSLKVQFDMECKKIKYIHKRMKTKN